MNKFRKFLLNTSTFLLNGNFDQKIHAEKLQNHRHQSYQGIKESVHFKMLFVSSRYLNLFPRYRISKDKRIKHIKYRGKWMTARCIVTYFFSGSVYVANSNSKKYPNSVFVTDQRICAALQARSVKESERENWSCERDSDSETLNIMFRFERRYLGNRKSHWGEMKSILKGRILHFYQCVFDFPVMENTLCRIKINIFLIRFYDINSLLILILVIFSLI